MNKKGEPRHGGRSKGTPNKRTLEVQERLDALGCDPIGAMAKIVALPAVQLAIEGGYITAEEAKNEPDEARERACKLYPPDLRAKMASELAQYIAPKRKAVEHSGSIDGVGPQVRIILNKGEQGGA